MEINIQRAIEYLRSHFDQKLGLIYESEDLGEKIYDDKKYDHQHIYYLYSDNLLAMYALFPFDKDLSNIISESLSKYILRHYLMPSKFFEALFGYTLPSQMLDSEDKIVEKIGDKIILAEIHNKQPPLNWEGYGNTLILKLLSELWEGNEEEAISHFEKAYSMWDGKGIFDNATKDYYSNYKTALLLYASKILDYDLTNRIDLEKTLWFMQLSNGGIASYSSDIGNPLGSANCETTSLTLLVYNEGLISNLRQQIGKTTSTSTPMRYEEVVENRKKKSVTQKSSKIVIRKKK